MTEILKGPHAIELGVERLSDGLLVAFPTETVYGLGADALDEQAVERVFALKGRPSTNPLIVHVSGIEMAKGVVAQWPESAQQIANAYWPGPVTIVLPKAACVPGIVCADGDTVAVRCPSHPCALALIEAFGKPIVGPSANPSGRISPTTPEHVVDGFDGVDGRGEEADLIVIDGGHCRAGIESTVVDLSGETVRVLRPGIIGAHAISETLGQSVECVTQEALENADGGVVRSPGVIGAHYQPNTSTQLVETDRLSSAQRSTALIAWSIDAHPTNGTLISISNTLDQYASAIYRTLHEADKSESALIWIEEPPIGKNADDRAIRSAILERLSRATHA